MKILLSLVILTFFFQIPITKGQTIEWQRSYWASHHPNGIYMAQNETGEDWFYDIKLDNSGTSWFCRICDLKF